MKISIKTLQTGSKCWLPMKRSANLRLINMNANTEKWEKVVRSEGEVHSPEHRRDN